MAQKITLQAVTRAVLGKKVKRLRKEGQLPANIYGKKIKSQSITVNYLEFTQTFDQAGETSLIDLALDKTTHPVLITNVQVDPVTDNPIHVDFRQVDLTEKVTANIPLVITGESPAVKDLGGVLETPLSEVEVEALPTDLPENIQIDISSLKKIGLTLTVGDLKVSSKVEIKSDPATPVVVISEPRAEEEPEPAPEAEEAAEAEEGTEADKKDDSPEEAKPDSQEDSKAEAKKE